MNLFLVLTEALDCPSCKLECSRYRERFLLSSCNLVEIVQISVSNEKRIRFNMSFFLLFSLFMPYIVVFKSTVQKYDIYSIPQNYFSPHHIKRKKGDPVLPSWVAIKTYFVFILTFQKDNLAKIVLGSLCAPIPEGNAFHCV